MTEKRKKILLVDDEPEVRTVAAHYLRLLGFDVVAVATQQDALDALAADLAPSMVVCDFQLKDRIGDRVLAAIRHTFPDLNAATIIWSGNLFAEPVARAVRAAFLLKGSSQDDFGVVIQKIMQRREPLGSPSF